MTTDATAAPIEGGDLESLRRELVAFGERRDWRRFHRAKDLCVSVSIEAAELLELAQWRDDDAFETWAAEHRETVAHECADVLSYLILLADRLQIDLAAAVRRKLALNETRFPVRDP